MKDKKGKFVLLEGLQHSNLFFSLYTEGEDPTKSFRGETWYRILGYADTVEEAQQKLYGFSPAADDQAKRKRLKAVKDLVDACTRMIVGITEESVPDCEWYEGIEHDGAQEGRNAIKEALKLFDLPDDNAVDMEAFEEDPPQ